MNSVAIFLLSVFVVSSLQMYKPMISTMLLLKISDCFTQITEFLQRDWKYVSAIQLPIFLIIPHKNVCDTKHK